ncbi:MULTISPECIES: FRG domain-containing protein [Pseudomonas]|jgi:hypothetical protein|uniref:FRG domain-containing protein n=1 Tax=Pseudomonas putida TaxID=303 RepID=A0A1L7NIB9_PSEPU|nr:MULTISPECIES: FRG domain-containing protein [Pseudomonas]PNB54888.1 FRG domain-containing protein [Pseudomonas sp. FW305-130]MBP2081566.1 hypothetical protein [Pseudomonas sp. PvP089]MBP2086817.1 hypothetical protein [Pseudomonas sp. PvP088]MBP2221022.1 hypothetical protein [Pseudomonas putida]MDO1497967.1 FRG domain-containing protein [Pseudomonas putida]
MVNLRDDIWVNDVSSYLNEVFGLGSKHRNSVRCYRGQADLSWDLKPSVMRGLQGDAEYAMFSELMLEAPSEFNGDKAMFDKLVRAQHYGLPTRLLDVSLNPLVSLYFACCEEEHRDKNGVVLIFDFRNVRVKFSDSDSISLVCNLARLSEVEKNSIIDFDERSDDVEGFRALAAMKRLTQFVRIEKPYFLDSAKPEDLFKYFFVYPAKNNRRVIAQSGAFIAAGLLKYKGLEKSVGFNIRKIIVPADKKWSIVKQLDALNINSRTMFPEVEFASKYIKDKWIKRRAW